MIDLSNTYLSESDKTFLLDAYQAVENTPCAWDWLKHNTKPFMFSNDPMLMEISKGMKYMDSHSGASFACTMRIVEFIAKNGEDAFLKEFKRTPPCYCRHMRGLDHGWCGVAGGGVPACDH
jgi:hypothetical protein